mgnify:CR=1 FL=1
MLGAVLLTKLDKMEQITITKEQFEKAIEDAFKKGESWGVCYSTWFTPKEADTKEKIDIAKKIAFSIVTEQS